jgi:RND family efflux transporter MFP subunit
VDQTHAALDVADAQYKLAANQDGYTLLKADHDGVVTTISAEAGQVVGAGQPVVTIAEDGEREVAISVPESRVAEIKGSSTFDVKLWAVPGRHYSGHLRDMAVDTDQATRTYAARISIINADDNVRLGMTANVYLPTNTLQGMPMPLTAIYDTDGKPRVWIVDKASGVVHARPVQLGEVHGDRLWITSGIQPGDVFVTAGSHLLHEGERVRLAESELNRP